MKKYILVSLGFCYSIFCMQEAKWEGAKYDQNSRPQFDLAMEYIQNLRIKPDEDILDIGCGSGKVTKKLACLAANGFVVGIDKSDSQIATAQKEYSGHNISFQTMDAELMTFGEEFDRIFSSSTFHWIKNKEAAFLGCARALKKGGLLHILTGGDADYKQPAIQVYHKIMMLDKWSEKMNGLLIQQFLFNMNEEMAREILEKADMEIKDIQLREEDMILPTREHFKLFINVIAKGAYSFFATLSAIEQNEFLEEFVSQYLELVPANEDGSVRYPIYTLIIEAFKK